MAITSAVAALLILCGSLHPLSPSSFAAALLKPPLTHPHHLLSPRLIRRVALASNDVAVGALVGEGRRGSGRGRGKGATVRLRVDDRSSFVGILRSSCVADCSVGRLWVAAAGEAETEAAELDSEEERDGGPKSNSD